MTAAGGRANAQRAPRASACAAAEGGSPRTVIRGESVRSQRLAIIDWLRFTFLPTGTVNAGLEQLKQYFALWFPLPVNLVLSEKGMFGYKSSYDVMVWIDGEFMRIAMVAMGGTTTGNTMMVDVSGKGCSLVGDWQAVFATLQDLDARLTRVDTALDADSIAWFGRIEPASARFSGRGRHPPWQPPRIGQTITLR